MGFQPQQAGWPPSHITEHQAVPDQSPEPISLSLKTPSSTLEDCWGQLLGVPLFWACWP